MLAADSCVRRGTLSDFTSIAPIYRQSATLQKSAAERLFWMLAITRADDVLDLGCGTGHLAQEIPSAHRRPRRGGGPLLGDDRAGAPRGA